MTSLSRIRLFLRASAPRFSGGAAKPSWNVPKSQMWHPQIPDKQHYSEHPTYTGFVLWLRGVRPHLERILGDTFKTSIQLATCIWQPLANIYVTRNPEFRLQLVAAVSWVTTVGIITKSFGDFFQGIVDVGTLLELRTAKDLEEKGFWRSESEDLENRVNLYSKDHARLTKLWEHALFEATTRRSFDSLVQKISVDESHVAASVPIPITWRFNMMPYGASNDDTQTFPVPDREQPLRSFALNFTYNNLSGDWGDYINRKDNKGPILRPARPMFTDVYIPGTK